MLWIYVLAATVGIVMLVPTVLQAIDGLETDRLAALLGFGLTVFAVSGFLLDQFGLSTVVGLLAAVAIAVSVSIVHPDILKAIAPEEHSS